MEINVNNFNTNSLLLNTINQIKTNQTPIWLMRQAGRYLPEYQKLRKEAGSFLNLCLNPELAKEITLQPIKRFNFDAAIVFSDILTIPMACNRNLRFNEKKGPILNPIKKPEEILNLKITHYEYLEPIYKTLSLVKKDLEKDKTLIGFVGAPFTIALYMIEGRSSNNYKKSILFFKENKELFIKLLNKLEIMVANHIIKQIESGAEVIQIFESHAEIALKHYFTEFCINPVKNIITKVKKKYPNTPIIGFPRNAKEHYKNYAEVVNLDCISIDQHVNINWAINNIKFPKNKKLCIQGNLNPNLLLKKEKEIIENINKILVTFSKTNHIFNLGHGVLKETPTDHIKLLVETIRNFKI